ncbi:MAG: carbonic anhydrase [Candidatus Eremiobacteraeota bacterium]|nr:carbonic anhydrase [Candidatus Eremiobacteraeota bacterium]
MVTRREFISATAAVGGVASAGLSCGGMMAQAAAKKQPSPKVAMQLLLAGNQRFVEGHSATRNDPSRREELAGGQQPFAIVLSCSDSRVPPELVFDRGLGDLFVVRVAGNYATSDGIGSIQYAVEHFESPLIFVLGHSSCGAIHATVDNLRAGSPPVPGNIQNIVTAIDPAAKAVLHKPGDVYMNAAEENVRRTVATIHSTHVSIAPAIKAGKLEVIGGIYDLASGRVRVV